MNPKQCYLSSMLCCLCFALMIAVPSAAMAQASYQIVDTGQEQCYDDSTEIPPPSPGESFYGQDAQYTGIQPAYQDNGDGTVSDLNTGLMWQQTPDLENKSTWAAALAGADTFLLAGYDNWRLPSIKELYSLIDFRGSSMDTTPYIDTTYFHFAWGDTIQGERLIDAQYWSSTEYVGLTMTGDKTAFGVNFADGRIKGYPTETGPVPGDTMRAFVRYVRAGNGYGVNDFIDNGNGTIKDQATGLMWMKADSDSTMNWEEALVYAENLVCAGYDDWRLPNAKELQSIVDYTRAPDAQNPLHEGPAIDTLFDISEEESYFWTSTTLLESPPENQKPGGEGAYIAFGQAWGYIGPPGQGQWLNVHGAGAQRSDPKNDDPDNYPYGRGPQGDEVRVFNYVRCVRGGLAAIKKDKEHNSKKSSLYQNVPNPFVNETNIMYELPQSGYAKLSLHNGAGQMVCTLVNGHRNAGLHSLALRAENLSAGVYFLTLETDTEREIRKCILLH